MSTASAMAQFTLAELLEHMQPQRMWPSGRLLVTCMTSTPSTMHDHAHVVPVISLYALLREKSPTAAPQKLQKSTC